MRKAPQFHNDLYFQDYVYLKGWTRKDVTSAGFDCNGDGFTHHGTDGKIYIWVDPKSSTFTADLGHECLHAANMTLGSRGVKICTENDEALAYLFGWIFNLCLKAPSGRRK